MGLMQWQIQFTKVGGDESQALLGHCIVEDGKGVGVVIKKRILMFMEELAKERHYILAMYKRLYIIRGPNKLHARVQR